jgi:streptomycin 6-kinase
MIVVPSRLASACRGHAEREGWLKLLPAVVNELQSRWALSIGPPFQQASCAWVAPVTRRDGRHAVLKLGMPHMEGRDEIGGLQFWSGDPTVGLLDSDPGMNAMLLEQCEPGTPLRELPETDQDVVIAGLLRRLRHEPPAIPAFRPLSLMLAAWTEETNAARTSWRDEGLVRAGLSALDALLDTSTDAVLLATDLHAGNVLRAQREPWLVIDPKPFVGDRAYDATQHLLNCRARVLAAPAGTIRCLADMADVDEERLRLWTFARSAAEPREQWTEASHAIARALA